MQKLPLTEKIHFNVYRTFSLAREAFRNTARNLEQAHEDFTACANQMRIEDNSGVWYFTYKDVRAEKLMGFIVDDVWVSPNCGWSRGIEVLREREQRYKGQRSFYAE